MAWYRCVGGAGGSLKLRTASGRIATFTTNMVEAFKSLKSDINPVQDLHGYSKPWSGGGGKNKLNITATTQTINGITFTIDNEGVITTSGTFSENTNLAVTTNFFLKAGTYILNGCPSGGSYSRYVVRIENGSAQRLALDMGSGEQFTLSEDTYVWCRIYLYSSDGIGKTFKPMVRLATESDSSFAPYSNICPISGFSALNVTLADGDMQTIDTKTVNFGQTVYGGVADVTNGKVTITHVGQTFTSVVNGGASSTASWWGQLLSSGAKPTNNNIKADVKADYLETVTASQVINTENDCIGVNTNGAINIKIQGMSSLADYNAYLANNPVTVVYELATPIEITTTPENLTAIVGQNNVYSDTNGDTEVKYLYRE